jgi:tRNA-specific 2-thiouridylase
MQLWNHGGDGEGRFDSCCSLTDVHDARLAAHNLGIPHYVVNYEREFKTGVVDYFAKEYAAGRTPNPCVLCNSKLKFDHLVERALALGADWVATGHYARLEHKDDGTVELLTGVDPNKDQSYFLFDVRPDYLKRAMFPLGGLTKPEVRKIAAGMGMHTAEKHESQEICFVTGRRYSDFLEQHYPDMFKSNPGEIVDRAGNVVGTHDGIHKFTVGQRKGLGNLVGEGTDAKPKYVAELDAENNRVVIDDMDNLAVDGLEVAFVNWLVPEAEVEDRGMTIMVRYRAKTVPCRVERIQGEDRRWRVLLKDKARWVTPGQAAVFYDGERVLGGGFIARTGKPADVVAAPSGLRAPVGGASADLRAP